MTEEFNADVVLAAREGVGITALCDAMVRRWISTGIDPEAEAPCAPFTDEQVRILAPLLDLDCEVDPILDVTRKAYIECLRQSWP